jgi:4'-phosphopantetheinyl transferase
MQVPLTNNKKAAPLNRLYPIILAVSPQKQILPGRQRVRHLSAHARKALELSQNKSHRHLDAILKNDQGIPMPSNGLYWSISHKTQYVAGIIAPYRVGIDLERIRDCHKGLYKKVAGPEEWSLSEEIPLLRFFRFWTAKEAVLKSHGMGIAGLGKCRIVKYLDATHLMVACQGVMTTVEHFYFDRHLAAVTLKDLPVEWEIKEAHAAC